jgi:DNA-binding CsgD family transcriptional regulator
LIHFDYCEQFVYRRNARPIHVYDNSLACAKTGLANYLEATYVLNPFFQRSRVGLKPGVYRLRDLANDNRLNDRQLKRFRVTMEDSEEIGYLTEGWPPGRQELCIALDLPTGELGEITVARSSNSTDFTAEEISLLALATPFLRAIFRHYWGHTRLGHGADGCELQGRRSLSPRERQVAQLLLRGHSSQSISLQLGISATTVKTHRKNLYSKLGIATHYELFALFMDSRALGDSRDLPSSATGRGPPKLQ